MFWGVNIGVGILISILIIGEIRLFGTGSFHWLNVICIGGFCLLVPIAVNLILLFYWVIPPLKYLLSIVKCFRKEDIPPAPQTIRIRELYELVLLFRSKVEYTDNLAHAGNEFLDKGELQKIALYSEDDRLGKTLLKFIKTLDAVDNHIEEIIEGHLFIDVPEELRETKLGHSLNTMTTELQTIIAEIRKETKSISVSSAKIAGMAQQGSRNATTETHAIENISSSIHEVAANLREVMENLRRQGDSLEKTFADIRDMLASTENINRSVELLSASADATSLSIRGIHEFMQEIEGHAHSLAEISETISTEATDGGQAVSKVIEGIRTIKETVEDAATAIRQLGAESGRIGEILEVIDGVAEQTNLLALNASIIAAQAGEHGRGFSVVADEIKELADRTRVSTQEIGEIIRSLQTEVHHGRVAMEHCLEAVRAGVELANQSGEILDKIVQSIQGAREMASILAKATVTQTQNSEQVNYATGQITQKLEELYTTASKQTQDSTHLAELANILQDVTQHIDQSAITQLQAVDEIVRSIEEIQELVRHNAKIAHQLAASSDELGQLEGGLAESMGHFLVTKPPLPANFDQGCPTIAFIYPGAPFFYNGIYQGIQNISSTNRFQSIALDSQNDPVLQSEYANWLMRQQWLKGLILSPFDDQTGRQIVAAAMKQKVPLVAVDRSAKNAHISVLSDNQLGGEYAAELLREHLPGESIVLACGPRTISSIFNRMEGFFKRANSYHWQVVEVFTPWMDVEQTKENILEGLHSNPEMKGIFLTNEHASSAYLELLREGKLPKQQLHAVSYDLNPEIAKAITDRWLLGTIFQDPARLGSVAAQELLALFQQPLPETSSTAKELLVPVKKITRDNLASE